jgi:hypothetical protein
MKMTFYEVLWELLKSEKKIEEWVSLGLLVKKQNEWYWTPDALEAAGIENAEPLSLVTDTDWIPEFIEKFSRKSIGIVGKTSSVKQVSEKMTRFLKEFKYDKTTILGATDMYIGYWKKQGKPQFIREAHYFIFKRTEKGSETSDLATWCETYLSEGSKPKTENRFGGDL